MLGGQTAQVVRINQGFFVLIFSERDAVCLGNNQEVFGLLHHSVLVFEEDAGMNTQGIKMMRGNFYQIPKYI